MSFSAYEALTLDIHKRVGVIDGHCDTIHLFYKSKGEYNFEKINKVGHVDLPRLEKGNVIVQFFAAYIEPHFKPHNSLKRAIQLIDYYFSTLKGLEDRIVPVFSYEEILKAINGNKISAILSIEGGEALEGDLGALRMLYRLGVRCLGLTWNQRNQIGDGIWEAETGGGLTRFGKEVIKEMNSLGMIIDLAHLSEAGFWNAIEITEHPLIVSHGNSRSLCEHPRNLSDKQLKALAENGGIIGLSFYPPFISANPQNATLDDLLDHFVHIAEIIGTDHIGIGSDFDGIKSVIPGLEDASKYHNITGGLLKRGFTEEEIHKILCANYLRVLQKIL